MLARLAILLSFNILIPKGWEFPIYEYDDHGYKVRYLPPGCSDLPPGGYSPQAVKMDGESAFLADLLLIDFYKEEFDRRIGSASDPPEEIINRAINSFLIRLRHVTHGPQVHLLDFPYCNYRLQYLNDDETELERKEGFCRARFGRAYKFGYVALNAKIVEDINSLPFDFKPQPWESLILDAYAELPSIGPSIVLAATALEIFISQVLDRLAVFNKMQIDLWTYISQRDDRYREPSQEEQYDVLLKFFTGHSLKEERELWESFKNLKTARNSFVHEGIPRIGIKSVELGTCLELISSADKIVSKIKEWLPPELHWPEFKHQVTSEAIWELK